MKKKASNRKASATKRRKLVSKSKGMAKKKDAWIGRLNGKIRIVGDVEAPLVPPEAWEYD